jgi:hypothetical protein
MGKRQVTKRSPRPKKTELDQLAAPVAEPAPIQPETPPAAANYEPVDEKSPRKELRERMTLFSFTLIAALVGVALGFYLGSEATRNSVPTVAPPTSPTSTKIDSDRARNVLVLIQEELVENARILKQQQALRQGGRVDPSVSFQFVKNDLWRAIINSNDIQAVQDLDLLRTIAAAYRYIDEIKMLERRTLEASSGPGKAGSPTVDRGGAISSSLRQISSEAEKSIVEAAVHIDHKLSGKH